jgi:predicted O-methyltransferase YrrM
MNFNLTTKNYNLTNLPMGFFNSDECKYLASLVEEIPNYGVIVEVGSFLGRTSVVMARHAKPNVKIFCIDIFPENVKITTDLKGSEYPKLGQEFNVRLEFKKNTHEFKNITPIIGKSPREIQYTNEPIDLFFLDGDHHNPNDLENLNFFCPLVKSGGLICGHDFSTSFSDVQKNVQMLETIYNQKAIVFPKTSLWMIRKP